MTLNPTPEADPTGPRSENAQPSPAAPAPPAATGPSSSQSLPAAKEPTASSGDEEELKAASADPKQPAAANAKPAGPTPSASGSGEKSSSDKDGADAKPPLNPAATAALVANLRAPVEDDGPEPGEEDLSRIESSESEFTSESDSEIGARAGLARTAPTAPGSRAGATSSKRKTPISKETAPPIPEDRQGPALKPAAARSRGGGAASKVASTTGSGHTEQQLQNRSRSMGSGQARGTLMSSWPCTVLEASQSISVNAEIWCLCFQTGLFEANAHDCFWVSMALFARLEGFALLHPSFRILSLERVMV